MDLAIAVLVVAGLGWALVEAAAVAGLFGAATGEQIERCARCRRYGLTEDGTMHPNGCPDHLAAHLRAVHAHLGPHHPHRPHFPH